MHIFLFIEQCTFTHRKYGGRTKISTTLSDLSSETQEGRRREETGIVGESHRPQYGLSHEKVRGKGGGLGRRRLELLCSPEKVTVRKMGCLRAKIFH